VRAQRGNSPASSEAVERRRKTEEGERKKGEGADQWPRLAEKEKERGARGPAWLWEREGKGKEGGARAGKEMGLGRLWAGERKRGREGPWVRERRERGYGLGQGEGLGCLLLLFSLSFSFSILH
jgi:hypothetical protein